MGNPIYFPNLKHLTTSKSLATGTTVTDAAALDHQCLDTFVRNDASNPLQITGTVVTAEGATAANGGALPALTKVVSGYDGANVRVLHTDASGDLQIDVLTSALPTGAATSANQATEIASLASIDAGIPAALGAATIANSMPVNIASDQTVPISAASLPLPAGASTSALQTTGNTSLASIDSKIPANLTVTATRLLVDGSGVTQPISGNVAATQSGTWTVQPGNTANTTPWLTTISQGGNSASVSAANALKVDGSAVTQPISAASLPLPTGAATSANQATEIASLASIDAGIPAALGSTTSANSMPVVIASDQAAIATKSPVNATGTMVNTSLTATTASSASAPANAIGFILEAPSTNTDNIRWAVGATASTTVGMLTEPGRDTGFVPLAATISVCATVSGTNAFSIQWVSV